MQDQDIINEEDDVARRAEEPTTLGCPSLGPKVLPSGFDHNNRIKRKAKRAAAKKGGAK